MIVYLVTNNVNGKRYVGQTSRLLRERWVGHQHPIPRQRNSCLLNAINKYGVENFEIVPLVVVETKQEADFYERELIRHLGTKVPNGYNIADGGGGAFGYRHTEEAKKTISKLAMGNKRPLGIKRSEETKQRMSEAAKGRVFTEEHRRNIGLKSKGRKFSKECLERQSVIQKKIQQETRQIYSLHTKEICAAGGVAASHLRWHINRGIVNLKCAFCREQVNGSGQQNRDGTGTP